MGRRGTTAANARRRFDETLQAVTKALRRADRAGAPVVTVSKLVQALGKDPRTIRKRLWALVLSHEVAFVDRAESAFALVEGLRHVLEKLARVERAEVLHASASSSARLIWGE